MKIQVKRAYDTAEKKDGFRVLVDRLWPRGVTKEKAQVDLWVKEVAPSNELRTWFHENKEERLKEFSKKYSKELTESGALKNFKKQLTGKSTVTLITGVKEIQESHIPTLLRRLNS